MDTLNLNVIYPNPDQPRRVFDDEKLEELAMSIRTYGVLEPIVVTPRGDRFMIVSGERRYRASLRAGLTAIPVRIIDADDRLVDELALLENIQRQDLNIIEEAKAYQALLDRGYTRDELAKKLGFKQGWRISERTSLLKLQPIFQQKVVSGEIGHSQAFEMSRLAPSQQETVYLKIRKGELSTYNKLRSFVDGLLITQDDLFALQEISAEERKSITDFESILQKIERFLSSVQEEGRFELFKKTVFHSQLNVQRIDLVIQNLMKLRKAMLQGAGFKEASEEATW